MGKIGFSRTAGLTWEVTLDGAPTGVTITAPDANAVDTVLVRLGQLVHLGTGAEIYTEHYRAYSEATLARQELPKAALPTATLDALDEASALVRELKAVAAEGRRP